MKKIRPATLDDALAMTELVNMAGEGLPVYLWELMSDDGRSAWEIGQERAQRETGAFSYRNTVVREVDGEVVACLIAYGLEDNPDAVDYSEMPPMFVPLQELEDKVPGSWYVNVLATYPPHRGQGYGRELLLFAEKTARKLGKHRMSIIVADSNAGARKLYECQGYRELAQRPIVKENWHHPGENWVLLVKELQ